MEGTSSTPGPGVTESLSSLHPTKANSSPDKANRFKYFSKIFFMNILHLIIILLRSSPLIVTGQAAIIVLHNRENIECHFNFTPLKSHRSIAACSQMTVRRISLIISDSFVGDRYLRISALPENPWTTPSIMLFGTYHRIRCRHSGYGSDTCLPGNINNANIHIRLIYHYRLDSHRSAARPNWYWFGIVVSYALKVPL